MLTNDSPQIHSWDYGMTDGGALWAFTMYAYRAAGLSLLRWQFSSSQPGNIVYRPALVAINQAAGVSMIAKYMQELGMTTLGLDSGMYQQILEAVPDMFGKSEKEIDATPPYIQYLKCEGGIESGDPGCRDHKFNKTVCENRKYRTSWHPGWKVQALTGNLMAITMLDAVEDALQGLMDMDLKATGDDVEEAKKLVSKKLGDLDREESMDYKKIFSEPFPDEVKLHMDRLWPEDAKAHLTDMDLESFFKKTSFCHTALLPSEIRFKGLLTNNLTTAGTILDQVYDKGVYLSDIYRSEKPGPKTGNSPAPYKDPLHEEKNGEMRLVTNGFQNCPEYLNLDIKDWFHTSSVSDGWQTLVLPNDSEKKYYNEFDTKNSKGYILVCLSNVSLTVLLCLHYGRKLIVHTQSLCVFFGSSASAIGANASQVISNHTLDGGDQ
jgi:hypothetical protein